MPELNGQHFDTVIIGAGMSGLAAGIRLAHFGRNVIILERHEAPGGLNSFYRLDGRMYDVGLHALTNYAAPKAKGLPFTKLLRQLRLSRDDFDLSEQNGSRIRFPEKSLRFTNELEVLKAEIEREFPHAIDDFQRLNQYLGEFDDTSLENKGQSAREVLSQFIHDPLLTEMLLLPLMYYGSANENDMDFSQFATMFKAIYREGFSRPFDGVKKIINTLLAQYKQLGGKRVMRLGVQSITIEDNHATKLQLDNGDVIRADHILSCAGHAETIKLFDKDSKTLPKTGKLSFAETIHVLKKQPKELGCDDTIVFFNHNQEHFIYAEPKEYIDLNSGVICFPNNYQYPENKQLRDGLLRITAMANHSLWCGLDEETYKAKKIECQEQILESALRAIPKLDVPTVIENTEATDMFTPRTIEKFTGHIGGAVYGAPNKIRDGDIGIKNLYLCGTDQGFLGIIGAMLSGISMANHHILQKS